MSDEIKLEKTKEEFESEIFSFIWDFKIADNILYNYDILISLIEKNTENSLLNKPIAIISTSILEAIMVDFISRLKTGTNHFPKSIKEDEKAKIKHYLESEGTDYSYVKFGGKKIVKSKKLKNFGFSKIIGIYEKYKLLGEDENLYENLEKLSYFRNRIHIKNYFENFEKDESITFSNKRTLVSLKIMEYISHYHSDNYPRWTKK